MTQLTARRATRPKWAWRASATTSKGKSDPVDTTTSHGPHQWPRRSAQPSMRLLVPSATRAKAIVHRPRRVAARTTTLAKAMLQACAW